MNKQIEALKMAIELINNYEQGWESDEAIATINACKEALAEVENPELVAVQYLYRADPDNPEMIPLYTHPATWKSLSDDEIQSILDNSVYCEVDAKPFARAIEQALKEKNLDSVSS